MTGVLNAVVGTGATPLVVGVDELSVGVYGASLALTIGTFDPGTVRGAEIARISSNSGDQDFQFSLSSVVVATFFKYILVDEGGGVLRKLNAADASFSNGAWFWGDGTDVVWDSGDAGQSRTVSVVF